MFHLYEIYVRGMATGVCVHALSEFSAREQYYMRHGGSSAYSGIGMNNISAVAV